MENREEGELPDSAFCILLMTKADRGIEWTSSNEQASIHTKLMTKPYRSEKGMKGYENSPLPNSFIVKIITLSVTRASGERCHCMRQEPDPNISETYGFMKL